MDRLQKTVFLKTLGCDKNTVDSQMIMGSLNEAGYVFTEDPAEAEIIIVNTCCFIQTAKEESIDTIFDLIPYKTHGKCQCIVVAGCMAQRYGDSLIESIPEVDYFIGVNDIDKIIDVITSDLEEKVFNHIESSCYQEFPQQRFIDQGKTTAYLKISEGCNKHCTYCAIPGIRGHYRSRQPEAIYAEAELLYAKGIRELIIIGEDITEYGKDFSENIDLSLLLKELSERFDYEWIRLLYLYPEGINEDLIDVIASHQNICHYIDMPIQHTEDLILKRMGRKIDKKSIYDKVCLIRKKIPDMVLRTTIITGFPGETEVQFESLLEDLKQIKFDRLGAFAYSQEENTPAAKFVQQISEKVKEDRRRRVYEQQESITGEKNRSLIGKTLKVLIEEVGDSISYGRTYGDAPEIDCGVIIEDDTLTCGCFYDVNITYSIGFDLLGEVGK